MRGPQNGDYEPVSVREIVNQYLIEQEFYYGKIPESDLNLRLIDMGVMCCIFNLSFRETGN